MHIVSLTQLETVMLDENDLLERNLMMVFVTPQKVEELCDDELVFPYPFAAMSEQGEIVTSELLQLMSFLVNLVYCDFIIPCHSYVFSAFTEL